MYFVYLLPQWFLHHCAKLSYRNHMASYSWKITLKSMEICHCLWICFESIPSFCKLDFAHLNILSFKHNTYYLLLSNLYQFWDKMLGKSKRAIKILVGVTINMTTISSFHLCFLSLRWIIPTNSLQNNNSCMSPQVQNKSIEGFSHAARTLSHTYFHNLSGKTTTGQFTCNLKWIVSCFYARYFTTFISCTARV